MSDGRISRTQLMHLVLQATSRRSTCNRRQVAAIFSIEGRTLSTGYNGAPSGLPHCLDVGCDIDQRTGGCIRAVHAEANAIAFAAKHGIKLMGSDLYCSLTPCVPCSHLIINVGVHRVFALEEYREPRGADNLIQAGIEVYFGLNFERYCP